MNKLSEFQIYAMIRQMEARLARLEARGRRGPATLVRRKLENYREELRGRIRAKVAAGETADPVLAEVCA
jgi:hypothetical protein